MVVVGFSHTNSGGSYWLSVDHLNRLRDAGWESDGCEWYKPFPTYADGIAEWEEITGQDPDAEGCECCGPPFTFYAMSPEDFAASMAPYDDDYEEED